MLVLTMDWDLRVLWLTLTLTARFYLLCLFVSAGYTLYFFARTVSHLRRFAPGVAPADAPRTSSRLIEMTLRVENLRQLNTLFFYLFGIFFANEVIATLRAIEFASMSLSGARIAIFEPLARFAFFVFAVIAFVHTLQWATAARLQSELASITFREQ